MNPYKKKYFYYGLKKTKIKTFISLLIVITKYMSNKILFFFLVQFPGVSNISFDIKKFVNNKIYLHMTGCSILFIITDNIWFVGLGKIN